MVQERVSACGSHSLELVIGQPMAELATGSSQGIQKAVAGIMEAVGAEDGFEAAFIEAGVVGYEGNVGRETVGFKGGQDAVFHLVPDIREERGILGVVRPQAVNLLAEPSVVVRIRMNKAVEGVHHFPIAHDDHAHRAHTAWATICSFKVYDDSMVQSITNIAILLRY